MDKGINILSADQINRLIILAASLKGKGLVEAPKDPAKFHTTDDITKITNKILVRPDTPSATTEETKRFLKKEDVQQQLTVDAFEDRDKFHTADDSTNIKNKALIQSDSACATIEETTHFIKKEDTHDATEKTDTNDAETQEICVDNENQMERFMRYRVVLKHLPEKQIENDNALQASRCGVTENMYKSYICTICDRSFSLKCNLRMHLSVHSGEKPYHCRICDKLFSLKGNLIKHLVIHSGEKPHKCKICDRCFSQKCSLQRHFLLIHGGRNP